ncbi:hypothetical protein [Marinicella litoralis]|uniref:Lipoprotein n=1 Tax=Marinicella litoralis TaxID=644220 RepID=A0A4R6XBW5_9GAMM|nr:hypothetical protein [Marinicella litoralis]TDR16755.1 hypothetical protein C8D91_2661 [Marinicella litoralis]
MRIILLSSILVITLFGCKNSDTKEIIDQLIKEGKNFTYKTVDQGFLEETFYTANNVTKVYIEFDILSKHSEGEWHPVNSLQLLDLTSENVIHIKYVVAEDAEFINVLIKFEDNKYFDEDFVLSEPIRTMSVTWHDREVQISAEGFEYALSIPFEVEFVGNLVSSMEVINQIHFE